MAKRIVIISDTQLPFEDRKAVRALIDFISDYQPDEIVHIGDLMDYPQPSRWSKDTRAEYEGSVFADSDYAKRRLLEPLREVYGGPVGVIEGNHDLRPRDYLRKYAPALAQSNQFDFDVLLDFDGFGINKLPDFYDFAPGWVMTHGHLGGIGLSRIAGNTALNAARRFGKSVIMGHTHRMGIASHTSGYDGEITSQVTGFEVGHLMDQKQAGYLKRGTGNWQAGFGIVHVDAKVVRPQTVPILGKKFEVDGAVYSIR